MTAYRIAPATSHPDTWSPPRQADLRRPIVTGLLVAEQGGDFIGRSKSRLFHYRVSPAVPHLNAIIADLVRYEQAHRAASASASYISRVPRPRCRSGRCTRRA